MNKILNFALALMLVNLINLTLTSEAQASVNVGKKEFIIAYLPIKEKTIIGLAPSAMEQFVLFLDDYFLSNTWQFKTIQVGRNQKGKKYTYIINAKDERSESEEFFQAYELEVTPKQKRIQLKLIASDKLIKKQKQIEQDNNTYVSYKLLREQMSEQIKAHLADIKDYWW